jgi:hypothetical protein
MTKVAVRFELTRPLEDSHLDRLAAAHGIYGILRVQPASDSRSIAVEYDASRLALPQVEAALHRAGLAVRRA